MALLPYILSGERVVGQGNGLYADTLNRALRALLAQSGHSIDADPFPGLPGPVCNAVAFGADATGTTDSRAALVLADTTAGTGRALLIPSGATLKVASNLTINGHLRIEKGGALKPASGVTVTINGPVEAGLYKIFDFSAGGAFAFPKQGAFHAEWFGVVGDGVTDDAPAMNAISTSLAAVGSSTAFARVYFDQKMNIALNSTWLTDSRMAAQFISRVPALSDALGVNFVWRGPYNGTMISFNRAQFCQLIGVGVKMTDGCFYGAGASISSTVNPTTLNFNGFQQADPSWVGKWILVKGAGVAGADLITTVQSQSGAGVITLAAAASTTVVAARYIVGATATSGPPSVGLDIDMVPSTGFITTECSASECTFNGIIHNQIGIRVANTSVNNCEFMRFVHNKFSGGWTGKSWLAPVTNTQSVTIGLGTPNTVTGTLAGFFVQNMIGLRIRVPGAGVAGAALDTIITGVGGAGTTATVQTAASTAVTAVRCLISEGVGTGIQIGDHSNSMRHIVEENNFTNLQYGVDHQNGSIAFNYNFGTFNEADLWLKSNSNPLVMVMNQSEASCQHIGGPATSGGCGPIVLIGPRCGTSVPIPGGAYIDFGPGTKNIECIGVQFDDLLEADATYWNLTRFDGVIAIRHTTYTISTGSATMAMAGYNSLNSALSLISEHEKFITDAPAQGRWMKVGTGLDDARIHMAQLTGRQAFHAPATAPTDAKLQIDQIAFWNDASGLAARARDHAGLYKTFRLSIRGVVDLTDGATVATDASLGDYFALGAGGAARTISNPTNPTNGQRITYQVWNNSGGVLTVTWGGAFKLAGWVDPANGKIRTITFVYYNSFGQWIQDGAVSPDL